MEELLKKIKEYNPESDTKLIEKAYEFADMAHSGQKRLSGEPFITHLLAVANILADWKMDTSSIAAGILHDSLEDSAATFKDLEKEFGETIALLVDGVTKIGELKLRGSTEEKFVENLRKMFLAMSKDLRVIVIKLADRLHNMQTLSILAPEKQKRIAKETMEIYAPLAERLGMGQTKGQLEDLAFQYLYPDEYADLVSQTKNAYKEAEKHVIEAKRNLLKNLAAAKIEATISGRAKHLYSLYRKLQRPEVNSDISLIHDLVALRVIVETVEQCYIVLSVVHKTYKLIPSLGISDYIAMPRPNGYRSIHTRVFGPDGRIIEIQIRTSEMHEEAEHGVAAHWYYSTLKSTGVSDTRLEAGTFVPEDKLAWVRQLANWQQEVSDNQEFMQGLKFDALSRRIFVYTPKGDVKDLPQGATPIDFAYTVHTELGDRTVSAKVNGKMVGFDYQLKSGDVCEVTLSKERRKPNLDWLKFVVTNQAKKEIQKGWREPI